MIIDLLRNITQKANERFEKQFKIELETSKMREEIRSKMNSLEADIDRCTNALEDAADSGLYTVYWYDDFQTDNCEKLVEYLINQGFTVENHNAEDLTISWKEKISEKP